MKQRNEKVAFWSSWAGVSVLGLGILCLVIPFIYLQGDTERMSEWSEVHQQLSEAKWFEQYFAFQSKIEPLGNNKYARQWAIDQFAGGMRGYFTVTITGWKKLNDEHESHQSFIVYFQKLDDRPLSIIKIEEQAGLRIVYEDKNWEAQDKLVKDLGKLKL